MVESRRCLVLRVITLIVGGLFSIIAFSASYEREQLIELGFDMEACPLTPASDYRSKKTVEVTFINDTGITIQPSWIDLAGSVHFRKVIGIRKSRGERTYAGTNWLFFDYKNKQCLSLWTSEVRHHDSKIELASLETSDTSRSPFICEWGDCIDGVGKEVWSSGVSYVGDHENNQRYGYGIFFDSDGDICESYFEAGFANGPASCLYKNGDKFFGYLKNGKRNGFGFYVDKSGYKTREGLYKEDRLVEGITKSAEVLSREIDQLRSTFSNSLIAAYLPHELLALPKFEEDPRKEALDSVIESESNKMKVQKNIDTVSPKRPKPKAQDPRPQVAVEERLHLAAVKLNGNRRSNVMWALENVQMNLAEMRLELLYNIDIARFNPSEQSLLDASIAAYCNSEDMEIFAENNIPSLWSYSMGENNTYDFLIAPSSCGSL